MGKSIKVHHVVLLLHGIVVPKNSVVDHIDGNPLNNSFSNLRIVLPALNSRNKGKQHNNKSGFTGVFLWKDNRGSLFWKARVIWMDGLRKEKSFSINKYGNACAFSLACEFREKLFRELVDANHGYTARHGK
jgi:hypothetical protein